MGAGAATQTGVRGRHLRPRSRSVRARCAAKQKTMLDECLACLRTPCAAEPDRPQAMQSTARTTTTYAAQAKARPGWSTTASCATRRTCWSTPSCASAACLSSASQRRTLHRLVRADCCRGFQTYRALDFLWSRESRCSLPASLQEIDVVATDYRRYPRHASDCPGGSSLLALCKTGIPKPIPRGRPLLSGAAGMPLSPVHSPTSAAAARRQIEMRQLFSPAARGAPSQPLAAGRGFEPSNGRVDRAARQERGGRHGQRGARRRTEQAQTDVRPNGHSAPKGLLSAALGQQAEPLDGVLSPSSAASMPVTTSDAPSAEGGQARASRSLTDLGAGFRSRGRGGRGRRGRDAASSAPPELEMVALTAAPPALASVASSDTASTISAPSGHASRTDTDAGSGRQHGRGDGGHGRCRCVS